ncbi:cytochrome c oxidase assembly factor 1 family protein [Flavobacterium sp. N2038]|uniref:cytochrome c oxidase assembly factor 1 family protein n=1 Tax=Flavobacterium sp. N2038 TaxID=2986829 RepID=UPI0022252CF1|nr:cytochrome c oxidase assembly factor 1 family protein [Flavobacterium sp. N2038]
MEDSNELIQRKSWWDRNWKWFVPTGCLSIIVLIGLFIAGVFFGVTSMMTESDVYKDSMIAVKNNKIIIEKLGNPVETDGMISGSISTSNNAGNCNLQVPLKGPKGKGTLFIIANKQGKWKYEQLSVYIEKTQEEIDLLQK